MNEVPPGSALLVGNVAVFNIAGSFCATQDKCTHGQGPLSAGKLDGSTVTCPDHGAVADGGVRAETNDGLSLTASANGPLLAQGAFVLRAAVGQGQYEGTNAELCRCGASRNKPFCDGTHERIAFRSEETGDD